ncbi:hypothetical protein [Oceanobacillus kapialis]
MGAWLIRWGWGAWLIGLLDWLFAQGAWLIELLDWLIGQGAWLI